MQVSQLAGAPPGEYVYAAIGGKDVFASRWLNERRSWLAVEGPELRPFLGDEEHDIHDLVTDGKVMWFESRDAYSLPSGGVVFDHYALYKRAFATDSAKLMPELLVADVPPCHI